MNPMACVRAGWSRTARAAKWQNATVESAAGQDPAVTGPLAAVSVSLIQLLDVVAVTMLSLT